MYTLKKSLGQHFLTDQNICRKIVAALAEYPIQRLLEIGPGGGALTKYLVAIEGIDFKAVEVDEEKVQFLLDAYPSLKGKLLQADFLEMEMPFNEPFTVVGNFPYNISTQILFKILGWKNAIVLVLGMFQKEVAQRIAAKPGSKIYGVTSVLVQAFFNVEYLFEVGEKSFQPPPKVKSAVIRLTPVAVTTPMRTESDFFRLVKAGFNHRRKTLRNAVRDLFPPEFLKQSLFDKRAEQLSVADFANLTFEMK